MTVVVVEDKEGRCCWFILWLDEVRGTPPHLSTERAAI